MNKTEEIAEVRDRTFNNTDYTFSLYRVRVVYVVGITAGYKAQAALTVNADNPVRRQILRICRAAKSYDISLNDSEGGVYL